MPLSCEKSKHASGVFIKACSSDGVKTKCTLGKRTNIKHIVTVTNLMVYPTNIQCQGKIQVIPKRVVFSSLVAGDTDSIWKAEKLNLDDSDTYSFASAILLPAPSATPGDVEKIDAILTIDRPTRPRNPEVVGLTIDVTV